jgi:hypothetical protein
MLPLTWGLGWETKEVQVQFRVHVSATELRRLAGAPDVVPLVETLSRAADGSLAAWIRWWRTQAARAVEQTADPPAEETVKHV